MLGAGAERSPGLGQQVQAWATPIASAAGRSSTKRGRRDLQREAVQAWATPTRTDAKASGSRALDSSKAAHPGLTLTDMAVSGRTYDEPKAPTCSPSVADAEPSSSESSAIPVPSAGRSETDTPTTHRPGPAQQSERSTQASERSRCFPTPRVDALFPTPTKASYGSSGNGCPGDGRETYAHAGTPSLDTIAKKSGGALNSEWVAALQGFPPGWFGPPPAKPPKKVKAASKKAPRRPRSKTNGLSTIGAVRLEPTSSPSSADSSSPTATATETQSETTTIQSATSAFQTHLVPGAESEEAGPSPTDTTDQSRAFDASLARSKPKTGCKPRSKKPKVEQSAPSPASPSTSSAGQPDAAKSSTTGSRRASSRRTAQRTESDLPPSETA